VVLADWLRRAAGRIDRLDARLLLEDVAGLTHAAIVARPDQLLSDDQLARLDALVERRAAGEPLAYLVGWAEFRGLRLDVSPAVLVPRPETEELVDRVLELLAGQDSAAVLDLGTGSGAIPLAIKRARPAWQVMAADVSAGALAVARGNAARLGLDLHFFESDWTGNLPAGLAVDCVVSNPPYVAAGDPHLEGDGLRFEPRIALTDFSDGLSCFRTIAQDSSALLKAGGWLLMEHGWDQAGAVRELLAQAGFDDVQSWRDLSGIERMTGGRRSN
jgi:release factor glutamine methyltransferase